MAKQVMAKSVGFVLLTASNFLISIHTLVPHNRWFPPGQRQEISWSAQYDDMKMTSGPCHSALCLPYKMYMCRLLLSLRIKTESCKIIKTNFKSTCSKLTNCSEVLVVKYRVDLVFHRVNFLCSLILWGFLRTRTNNSLPTYNHKTKLCSNCLINMYFRVVPRCISIIPIYRKIDP